MVKYRDIYSVRLQLHISLRHASNRCAPQMIPLAVATARSTYDLRPVSNAVLISRAELNSLFKFDFGTAVARRLKPFKN